MDNISTATGETEDSLTPLTASEAFSVSCESEEIPMPAYHGSEHSDNLLQSPIGQCSVKTTSTGSMMGSIPPASNEVDSSMSIALGAEPKCQEGLVKSKRYSFSLKKLFMYLQHFNQFRCYLSSEEPHSLCFASDDHRINSPVNVHKCLIKSRTHTQTHTHTHAYTGKMESE